MVKVVKLKAQQKLQLLNYEKPKYNTHLPVMGNMWTKFEVDPSPGFEIKGSGGAKCSQI